MSVKQKDYAISALRFMSVGLVVLCHLLEWMWSEGDGYPLMVRIVGNYCAVGVQIFLLISGFLYGSKEKLFGDSTSRISFVLKNFWKVLRDYYLSYLLVTIPLCILTENSSMTWETLFGALTGWCTFGRQLQLWFIPYILFCYLITPMMHDIREWICKRNVAVGLGLLLLLIEVLFLSYQSYFQPAWICCYVIGFFLPKLKGTFLWNWKIYVCACIVCIVGNIIKGYLFYYIQPILGGYRGVILQECYNWVQVLLGLLIFIGIYEVLHKKVWKQKTIKILEWSDKYSYDIYIMHMFFVKGMLSTVFLTGILPLDIAITFGLIIVSGMLLHGVAGGVSAYKRSKDRRTNW